MTFFNERLKGFEIMMKTVPRYRCMNNAKEEVIEKLRTSRIFKNDGHKERFMCAVCKYKPTADKLNSLLAALYILTSSRTLWSRTENCVYCNDIDFDNIVIKNVCPTDYCLLKAAEDIYTNSMHFSVGELASPSVISDVLIKIIINAIKIKRGKFGG